MVPVNLSFPRILFVAYLVLFIVCGWEPYDRDVWIAENLPVLLVVAGIVWLNHLQRFSVFSFFAMSVFIVLHTIGGHYTFERVPFDAVTQWFGFERNHYDRIAHFSVGFYAYPLAERLVVHRMARSKILLFLFPLFAILSVAALYEVFEWQYAIMADAQAGIAVLGSQGDIWDAQKDITADGLGALLFVVIYFLLNAEKIKRSVEA